jgi:hypothetical protein
MRVSMFQRSGPFAGALGVEPWKGAADEDEEQTRPTANSDFSPGP